MHIHEWEQILEHFLPNLVYSVLFPKIAKAKWFDHVVWSCGLISIYHIIPLVSISDILRTRFESRMSILRRLKKNLSFWAHFHALIHHYPYDMQRPSFILASLNRNKEALTLSTITWDRLNGILDVPEGHSNAYLT